MFPDDCAQYLCSSWWEPASQNKSERWQLAWAYVRHVCNEPYECIIEGRTNGTEHSRADITIAAFNPRGERQITPIPIAAIPKYQGERLTLNRGKIRPVLIVAGPGTPISTELIKYYPKAHYAKTYLVAPYYSASPNGQRAGISEEFTKRVKRFEYSQLFWDILPINKELESSILRLDQIQPVEPIIGALEPVEWRLAPEAKLFMYDYLIRHLTQQNFTENSFAASVHGLLCEHPLLQK